MVALGRFKLHVSWMRIRCTRPTIRKSLVVGAGFEPAKPEGKRFWRGRWGMIPQPSDRQSEALTKIELLPHSLSSLPLEYPTMIGDSTETRTPILWMKTRIPDQLEDRVKPLCTSTYHLTASSWLLVDLAVILSWCCIGGVASDHTLLCREKRSRYIWYVALSITLQPHFLARLVGLKPTTHGLTCK